MQSMIDKPYYLGSKSVVSIAAVVDDKKLKAEIICSDYIRNETLRRCQSIPSYMGKSLEWKNRYYRVIQKKVVAEIEQRGLV